MIKFFLNQNIFSLGKFHRLMKQGLSGEEALAQINITSTKRSSDDEEEEEDDEEDDDEDDDLE